MAAVYLERLQIPELFEDTLQDLIKDLLRAQPEDILAFCLHYFKTKQGTAESPFGGLQNEFGKRREEETNRQISGDVEDPEPCEQENVPPREPESPVKSERKEKKREKKRDEKREEKQNQKFEAELDQNRNDGQDDKPKTEHTERLKEKNVVREDQNDEENDEKKVSFKEEERSPVKTPPAVTHSHETLSYNRIASENLETIKCDVLDPSELERRKKSSQELIAGLRRSPESTQTENKVSESQPGSHGHFPEADQANFESEQVGHSTNNLEFSRLHATLDSPTVIIHERHTRAFVEAWPAETIEHQPKEKSASKSSFKEEAKEKSVSKASLRERTTPNTPPHEDRPKEEKVVSKSSLKEEKASSKISLKEGVHHKTPESEKVEFRYSPESKEEKVSGTQVSKKEILDRNEEKKTSKVSLRDIEEKAKTRSGEATHFEDKENHGSKNSLKEAKKVEFSHPEKHDFSKSKSSIKEAEVVETPRGAKVGSKGSIKEEHEEREVQAATQLGETADFEAENGERTASKASFNREPKEEGTPKTPGSNGGSKKEGYKIKAKSRSGQSLQTGGTIQRIGSTFINDLGKEAVREFLPTK